MLQQLRHGLGVKPKDDLGAFHQNGPLDEIGILGHEAQGFLAGRWILFHAALAVKLIAGVEEKLIVALADQVVELLDR